MELHFLGTGSAYPSPTRGASCTVLRYEGSLWLFDCGEGTQVQLMRSVLRPGKIDKIFITHLHGDHMFGLPGLMCTISQSNVRTEPIEVYGPRGLRRFLRVALELSRSQLSYTFIVHELALAPAQLSPDVLAWKVDHSSSEDLLHPNEVLGRLIQPDTNGVWHLCETDSMIVKAVFVKHKIPSFAFCVDEKPTPGKLDMKALKERGVSPGPVCAQLKQGRPITLPDGSVVLPSEVLGPEKPGRRVIIAGDSCDSDELLKVGSHADVLVHEATMENSCQQQALDYGHSTPAMVAKLARALEVRQLILTHFSQRFKPASLPVKEGELSVVRIQEEAEEAMEGAKVLCVEDFQSYSIPRQTDP